MAKYYFHITSGDFLRDDGGSEFEFAEAARAHAIAMARELSKTPMQPGTSRYISVRDEAGAEIFKVPL